MVISLLSFNRKTTSIYVGVPNLSFALKFLLHVSILFCFGVTIHREFENRELSLCSMITWIMHWIFSIGSFIACRKKYLNALFPIM